MLITLGEADGALNYVTENNTETQNIFIMAATITDWRLGVEVVEVPD